MTFIEIIQDSIVIRIPVQLILFATDIYHKIRSVFVLRFFLRYKLTLKEIYHFPEFSQSQK